MIHSIPSLANANLTQIPILIFLSLSLFLFQFLFLSHPIAAMRKIHPIPSSSKRNLSASDDDDSNVPFKRLRRLPHVFSKVLELPFRSDADVAIEETDDCLRFVADVAGDEDGEGIRAHVVEVYPGVTKVVVKRGEEEEEDGDVELLVRDLQVDTWRFRLPGSARMELARASVVCGELVVTVPKSMFEEAEGFDGVGRLVLLQ